MKKLTINLFSIFLACFFAGQLFSQATDATITDNALFGGLRARQIGPAVMSGRVSSIDAVDKNPEIIYVGSAGGGVWKSNSGGARFRPVFDDYTMSIGKITIDQNQPDTVWVGTGETWVRNSVSIGTGIYKSTNGGSTWEFKGLPESERIADIIIHPKDPNIVFVAVMGHLWNANQQRGIYKTSDGGDSWEKIFYVDENTGCSDLDIDLENPDIMYAAMWSYRRYPDFFDSGMIHEEDYESQNGLFKSTDGGESWQPLKSDLPAGPKGRLSIAVAPTNGNTVYLSVESEDKEANGIYKSRDAGKSWTLKSNQFNATVRPFYFANMVVDPMDENILYKCGYQMIMSEDGGDSFRSIPFSVHADIHDVWIDPNNTKHVLVGTDGGVYESFDRGYSFKMFMNLPISQFYRVSVDNEEPFNIYGGLQDNGSWYVPSQKAGGISNSDWKRSYGGDGFYSFRHPTDKDIIYSEYQGGNLVRYNKKTGQAKDIKPYPDADDPKFRFNWNTPVHISRNNPERLYFGAQFLFVTEDRGDSWKKISPDLTTNNPERQRQKKSGGLTVDNSTAENNTTIYTIAESPVDENIIWVGTDDGNIQVTKNFGKQWVNVVENIPELPKGLWITHIEASNHYKNTAYVTVDGHRSGDKSTYVYKTTDLGNTWTLITDDGVEGYALILREDLENPDLLYLGTEFGLYISLDGGKGWARFDNNVPRVGIRDMIIHPHENSLVMGTHGRGVIIIDDLMPLRQINREVLAKKVHFFETEPTILKDPGAGGGWFGGDGNFTGPNPTSNAQVTYYLSKRHTFGKMYFEIYDPQGNMIRELPAGKSKGINVLNIPTRLRKPRAAPTNNRMALFGSLFGPNLLTGTYKAKLIKGKDEYSTEFKLSYDEETPYALEGRNIQYKTVMKLYNMSERLAWIYETLENIEGQIEKVSEHKKVEKKLRKYKGEINAFKNSIVALGGDFYVDEEERIREKISDLYRLVSQYPGRPSDAQLNRTNLLANEMEEIEAKFNEVVEYKLSNANSALERYDIRKIKYQSWESFAEN